MLSAWNAVTPQFLAVTNATVVNTETMGELLRKSGDDLLECKNFGVTSLNEVREKLTQMGLKLRGD